MDAQVVADTIATPRNTSSITHKETWRAKVERGSKCNERHKRRRKDYKAKCNVKQEEKKK
jgi:hypothetical protein